MGANPFLDYTDAAAGDPSEQLYQFYLRAGREQGRDHANYLEALLRASGDREGGTFGPDGTFTQERPPNYGLPLRNAQHGLVAQVDARESPYGKAGLPIQMALYNFLKLIAQGTSSTSGIPAGLDFMADRFTDGGPNALTQASPPSWESLKWGLRPFWGKD